MLLVVAQVVAVVVVAVVQLTLGICGCGRTEDGRYPSIGMVASIGPPRRYGVVTKLLLYIVARKSGEN